MTARFDPYTVYIDTSEQLPWKFNKSKHCLGSEDKNLFTGDYTLRGYEDLLCIERKGCVSELAKNVTEDRFEEELERMRAFKYRYVICAFTHKEMLAYPKGSGIPWQQQKLLRVKGPYMLRRITELEMRYSVNFILAGEHAQDVATSIFKRVVEAHPDRWN